MILIAPELAELALVPRPDRAAVAPLWPIPVRKDMLSQVDGLVWSLHVWLLQGYQTRRSALQSRAFGTLTEA